ncbi:MAG: response regulator [Pseudomonadota bacterium]
MSIVAGQHTQESASSDGYLKVARLRAVLVEPSSTQRRIIGNHLEDQGVSDIAYFDSGESALAYMHEAMPDLVVSAMYLPDMSGTDLIHQMRSIGDLESIGFLLISSETDLAALEPIRQAGAIGILPKPFNMDELQRALVATVDLCFAADSQKVLSEKLRLTKVLAVDDSNFSRKHIVRVLNALGISDIDCAENGKDAIELLAANTYGLLVTDYVMPEMDGKELIEHIRSQNDPPDLPILMITSEQDCERLTLVEQSGVSAICDKPFLPHTIRNLLQNLLDA